jgi:hypothetical protein
MLFFFRLGLIGDVVVRPLRLFRGFSRFMLDRCRCVCRP